MAELREALTAAGFEEVATHIQTSNAEVEGHLGVATTRNLTVITKLAEKWGQ